MNNIDLNTITKLSICTCRSRSFIAPRQVAQLAAEAEAAGCQVELIADFCEACEENAPLLNELGDVVAACHPRAVKSLLEWRGVAVPQLIDLRALSTLNSQLSTLNSHPSTLDRWLERVNELPQHLGSDAWYPTMDKSQCAECGKCLEFCPFGVYEMVDDRVRVAHPHQCKNNCPACARICPANAVIFPKYERSPINGGEAQEEQAVRTDISSLYTDELRRRLQQRRAMGVGLFRGDGGKR